LYDTPTIATREPHAHDVLARLGEGDSQRQPDVPEADDPDTHSRAV
jgi:hypothetical protein